MAFKNSILDNLPKLRRIINVATVGSFFSVSERFFNLWISQIFAYVLH